MAPRLSLVACCEKRSGGGRGGKNENKFSTISSSPANKQLIRGKMRWWQIAYTVELGSFGFVCLVFYHTMFQKPDCACTLHVVKAAGACEF